MKRYGKTGILSDWNYTPELYQRRAPLSTANCLIFLDFYGILRYSYNVPPVEDYPKKPAKKPAGFTTKVRCQGTLLKRVKDALMTDYG